MDPQGFQRLMDKIFKDLRDFCVIYIDDNCFMGKPRRTSWSEVG